MHVKDVFVHIDADAVMSADNLAAQSTYSQQNASIDCWALKLYCSCAFANQHILSVHAQQYSWLT